MPRQTKSKAVAVIDGQIKVATGRLAYAKASMESAQCTLDILEETRSRVLSALASRKKPEKASKTTPAVALPA